MYVLRYGYSMVPFSGQSNLAQRSLNICTFSPRYSNIVRQSHIRKEILQQSGLVVIDNY
jgi:hypothetical protein